MENKLDIVNDVKNYILNLEHKIELLNIKNNELDKKLIKILQELNYTDFTFDETYYEKRRYIIMGNKVIYRYYRHGDNGWEIRNEKEVHAIEFVTKIIEHLEDRIEDHCYYNHIDKIKQIIYDY